MSSNAVVINDTEYEVETDGEWVTLTNPTGAQYSLMPTFRAECEYYAISNAKRGKGLGVTLAFDGETVRVVS